MSKSFFRRRYVLELAQALSSVALAPHFASCGAPSGAIDVFCVRRYVLFRHARSHQSVSTSTRCLFAGTARRIGLPTEGWKGPLRYVVFHCQEGTRAKCFVPLLTCVKRWADMRAADVRTSIPSHNSSATLCTMCCPQQSAWSGLRARQRGRAFGRATWRVHRIHLEKSDDSS